MMLRLVILSAVLVASVVKSSKTSPTTKASQTNKAPLSVEEEMEEIEWTLSQLPHHRSKRFFFMTDEKRIVLPPGTNLVLTPTLAMPFLRYPPPGLDSNMTISTPFTIGFDSMGITDNQNPFGLLPFLNPFVPVGRRKRSLPDPDIPPHQITGGERAFLYEWAEDYLFTFGMDGKACLLRAICETHEAPMIGYGLVGEFLEVFLSPSRSPYWGRLDEYIKAERRGREKGDCSRYFKPCAKSLYKLNKYSEEAQNPAKSKHQKNLNLKDLFPMAKSLLNDIM